MKNLNQHLTEKELADLTTASDKLILLEHIKICPLCSGRLAEYLSGREILPAPHYLKQNILEKAKHQKHKKQEFYTYCIKVGLAVAASLAIVLFSDVTAFTSIENRQPKTTVHQEMNIKREKNISQKIYQGTDKINQKIVNFTDSLFHIS